jgi:IMP dehydrogenase
VMMGNMFAGCEESPGEIEIYRNRAYKVYRGMGSVGAMKSGSSDRYMQIKESGAVIVPEGVEGRVPFKGALKDTVAQLVGGMRSGFGYVGAGSLAELHETAEFMKITGAGLRESHPHDVQITKEPPNYSSPFSSNDGD